MTTILVRRGTSDEWSEANPILSAGEPSFEIDTGRYKVGDGVNSYNDLPFFINENDIPTIVSPENVAETLDQAPVVDVLSSMVDAVSPTVLFAEDFMRCIIDDQPTSSNTAYDNSIGDTGDEVSGGVVASVVEESLFGGQAVNFNNPAVLTTTYGFLGKTITVPASGKIYLERYYKVDVRPSYRTSILLYKQEDLGAASHVGSFALGGSASSYKFVLVNVDANSTTSTNDVPIGEWFRVVITLDIVAHTQTADLYLGDNVFGANPTETITSAMGETPLGYLEDGILTNPNVSMNIQLARPRNTNTYFPPTVRGPAGQAGVIVLQADDNDPSDPVPGTLYVRMTS